jgi:RPA family protein
MSSKLFVYSLLNQLELRNGDIYLQENQLKYIWIQGMVASLDLGVNELLLDDGTGGIVVVASAEDLEIQKIEEGDYIMVSGRVVLGETPNKERFVIVDSRMIARIDDPNLETLWNLEVIQYYSSS